MFSVANPNPAVRRFLPGTNNEQWVDFRILSDSEYRVIKQELGIRKVEIYPVNEKTGEVGYARVERPTAEQEKAFSDEVNVRSIDGWHLVDRETKEPIPCTRENKLALSYDSPHFSIWSAGEVKEIREAMQRREAAVSKNS